MAKIYCHVSEHEKEIPALKEQGYTKREIVARQEAKIKALEMENELMRDLLSLMMPQAAWSPSPSG